MQIPSVERKSDLYPPCCREASHESVFVLFVVVCCCYVFCVFVLCVCLQLLQAPILVPPSPPYGFDTACVKCFEKMPNCVNYQTKQTYPQRKKRTLLYKKSSVPLLLLDIKKGSSRVSCLIQCFACPTSVCFSGNRGWSLPPITGGTAAHRPASSSPNCHARLVFAAGACTVSTTAKFTELTLGAS